MTNSMSRAELEAAFARECKAMTRCGRYKVVRDARKYVESTLGAYWRSMLHLDRDASVGDLLGLTDTQCLLFHLFGRGVLNKGRSALPTVRTFLPVKDDSGNALQLRALPKSVIADVIGRKSGQVRHAIDALRGKSERARNKHGVLLTNDLAFPLFVPTGVMLDFALSRQRVFPFEEPDYEFAKMWARSSAENDRPLQAAQQSYCEQRLWALRSLREQSIRRANSPAGVLDSAQTASGI